MVIPVSATMPDSTLTPDAVARKFQSTSLMGLGDGSDDSGANLCALYPAGCGGGAPSSSGDDYGGGTDWTSVLTALTKGGVDLTKLALVQPGTILNANGTISRQNPGYSIPGTNSASLGLNTNVGLGGNTLLLLGLGVAALFLFSSKH